MPHFHLSGTRIFVSQTIYNLWDLNMVTVMIACYPRICAILYGINQLWPSFLHQQHNFVKLKVWVWIWMGNLFWKFQVLFKIVLMVKQMATDFAYQNFSLATLCYRFFIHKNTHNNTALFISCCIYTQKSQKSGCSGCCRKPARICSVSRRSKDICVSYKYDSVSIILLCITRFSVGWLVRT